MLSTIVHPGPDREPREATIDRTRIFDAADIWPDPLACPDWPYLPAGRRYDGAIGRRGAENRLETLGHLLNRGERRLRVPTADDCEAEIARIYRRDRPGAWLSIGFGNLSPRGLAVEGQAELLIEACLVRGYLRKLDAAEAKAAEDAKRRKEAEARRTLDKYRESLPGRLEEIASLEEAAERHRQRIADEKAASQQQALRQSLRGSYDAAVTAAHALGLSVPDAPDFA